MSGPPLSVRDALSNSRLDDLIPRESYYGLFNEVYKPLTAADMAKLFTRAKADRIEELLQSLVILGSARQVDGNKFVAA